MSYYGRRGRGFQGRGKPKFSSRSDFHSIERGSYSRHGDSCSGSYTSASGSFKDIPHSFGDRGAQGSGKRGRPPGLRGKQIGLYYARRSKLKMKREDIVQRPSVTLDEKRQHEISHLLKAVRSISHGGSTPNSSYKSSIQDKCSNMKDSAFKFQYIKNLIGNASRSQEGYMDMSAQVELQRNPRLDERLKSELTEKHSSSRYKKMLEFRKKLPAMDSRRKIVTMVESNQVSVISGETGCGKTTQVSQFILDEYITRGEGSLCRVVCTQPRRISAVSVAERVAEERDESCGGGSVGYQIRLESKLPRKQGSILYCTTGILIQWLQSDPYLCECSHIILDEIHERDILSDLIITIVKDILPKRPDLKLILMSATLNASQFSRYYHNCPMIEIPGFTYPVEEFYLEDVLEMTKFKFEDRGQQNRRFKWSDRTKWKKLQEFQDFIEPHLRQLEIEGRYSHSTIQSLQSSESEEINLDLVATLVHYICSTQDEGAILVFLPGWMQISSLHKLLTENVDFRLNPSSSLIIPLHSMMPTLNQREVFNRPPKGIRKIIIATNIAETSITVEDVVYVIDCGKIKMKTFDEENNLQMLLPEWVSLANARQRRGRAGRVQPGVCYHLFTRAREMTLSQFPLPEMLRTRLEEVILQVKILQLGFVEPFLKRVMNPPSARSVRLSVELLQAISALDDEENLTPLGFHLAQLPLDPQTGKMILMGAIFSCLDPVLSIAASLSFKDAFVVPLGKEKIVDNKKKELAANTKSDHIMLARAIEGWERAMEWGEEKRYCREYFLSMSTLNLLNNMKKQFAEFLYEKKFILSKSSKDSHANKNSNNINLIKAIICSGLYPNVAKARILKRRRGQRAVICTPEDGKVYLHPKSVSTDEKEFESRWLVYHLKLKSTQVFLHDVTMVYPFALLFFGKKVDFHLEEGPDGLLETIQADDNVKFHCVEETAVLVQELRSELDNLLEYKISHPGVTDWHPDTKEGALLRAAVELITSEDMQMDNGQDEDFGDEFHDTDDDN